MGYWLCFRKFFRHCKGVLSDFSQSRKGVRRLVPHYSLRQAVDELRRRSSGAWPWQDIGPMRSQAAGRGKIPPRCVPEGASDGKSAGSRQHIACIYSNTANFGKICVACIRKAPQSAVGEHTARTSCRQGAFSPSEALRSCTAHESCHPLMDLALAQGLLPEQPHRGIAFKRLGPCAGTTSHAGRGSWTLLNAWPMCRDDPSAPPMPATCQCLPLAVPVAARDKPPMDFGGGHPAHGLRFGQAPRGRRLHRLDGQADNGVLRRAGPELQNREQVGAEPPAEAAGPACVSAAENAHRKDESLLTEL